MAGTRLPRGRRGVAARVDRGGYRGERRDNPSFSSRQSFITATTRLNFDQQLRVSSFIPGDCIFVPSRAHGIVLSSSFSSSSSSSSYRVFLLLISLPLSYSSRSRPPYISTVVCSTENRVCSRSYRGPSNSAEHPRFRKPVQQLGTLSKLHVTRLDRTAVYVPYAVYSSELS